MNQPILVTGGSGTLGRAVVARLLDAGHQVRVLSRQPRPTSGPAAAEWVTGDLVSGERLATAVAGVAAVVHCASDPRARRVDIDGTRNLLQAARAAGTPQLIYISIVGVDRVPYRYYQAKLEAERLIQASGLPWTILRATQFHQLILLVAQGLARLPVVPVPAATSFQPIDAAEVADRLAGLAIGPPSGRVPDMGGPQVRTATDLLRAYLNAAGRRRLVMPVRLPGAVFAGYRQGGNLSPDHAVGRRTWEEFLAQRVARAAVGCRGDHRARQDLMARPTLWLRAGLVFYLGVELLVGAWAAGWPRGFYDDFPWPGHPWVGLLPAYNQHLVRDFGAMNLALAVVFGVAAATLDRRLAATALVAYLVFAVPHLVFHLYHLEPFGTVDAVAQPAALVALALLPVPLLALVHRVHVRRRP